MSLFEIPTPAKLWVAVRQTPHSIFTAFIDWESVSGSQQECEDYAAQWYEGDDVVICEFAPVLVPVKEIVSEYTQRRMEPVETESEQRPLFGT